ncbi:MAG: sigma-70 family RNA polymerase sigma factor [Alphaproteobacteria bacterium]|nr:sigma-70 family RNA polymerase sigma factor [Alphaproteobacteria bacterium]
MSTAHAPPSPADLEAHRRALTAHCYRMLGSITEAEDAVQETLLRAWRKAHTFEGRSALRTWLFRIATRVCLDLLDHGRRRLRPASVGRPGDPRTPLAPPLPPTTWIEPIPDTLAIPVDADADTLVGLRQGIRLAFVAALQHLPPRQRAVVLLREVLDLSAADTAEALATTVPSVSSALQRARATLATVSGPDVDAPPLDADQDALLDRYVDAFERYDMDALTALLHDEVALSMPPFALWLVGPDDVRTWMLGQGAACRGSRMVPVRASGQRAWGQYKPDDDGSLVPWSLVTVDVRGDRITGMCHFLDTATLFPRFGLPDRLDP